MEVSSASKYLREKSGEFEFQMCWGEFTSTNPADELFYKGKLLPLHLPPRLQMVQNLTLTSHNIAACERKTPAPLQENSSISPSESCRVSSELNADDYFFEMNGFIGHHSVSKQKQKQIKQSSISQKLKASRAYLKSLFSKSGCSDESCAKAACNVEAGKVSKNKISENKYMKMAKKNPFGKIYNGRYKISSIIMKSIDKELAEDAANSHRRSFSGVIRRHSTSTSNSSSLSSFSSSGFHELQLLKRSNSANSEIEFDPGSNCSL